MTQARDLADLAGAADAGTITGRNLIINGAMQVAQRSTSVASLGTANGYNTVDRWQIFVGGTASAGRFTQSQASVTDLAGFPKSLKHEVTTDDTSIAAGEALQLSQLIEGQNLQALKKGYSDAEQFTVSFYVKGTAKTYVVEMYDADNTRHVAKTFSVTSSWSRVELTFPADTTGKLDNDNAVSLYLIIWLHAGSDYTSGTLPATWASVTSANRAVGGESLYSATSNTFEITGVQLEVGSTATPFEHEIFGTTFEKCKRYFQKSYEYGTAIGANTSEGCLRTRSSGTGWIHQSYLTTSLRGHPTVTSYSTDGTSGKIRDFSGGTNVNAGIDADSESSVAISGNVGGDAHSAGAQWTADAEL
jgi:hypothetical protein